MQKMIGAVLSFLWRFLYPLSLLVWPLIKRAGKGAYKMVSIGGDLDFLGVWQAIWSFFWNWDEYIMPSLGLVWIGYIAWDVHHGKTKSKGEKSGIELRFDALSSRHVASTPDGRGLIRIGIYNTAQKSIRNLTVYLESVHRIEAGGAVSIDKDMPWAGYYRVNEIPAIPPRFERLECIAEEQQGNPGDDPIYVHGSGQFRLPIGSYDLGVLVTGEDMLPQKIRLRISKYKGHPLTGELQESGEEE